MAIKYLAGERLIGTAAERTAMTTSATVVSNTSWKELTNGRATVSGSAVSTISTGTFAEKDNLMILFHVIEAGGTALTGLHFNDDNSSANYSKADSDNGSANGGEVSINTLTGIHKTTSYEAWGYGYIRNKVSGQKHIQIYSMKNNGTGTGATVEHRKYFGSWTPDTASHRINKMTLTASGTNLGVDTEILVLGFDDDEADTGTNYWQRLATDDLSSTSDDLPVSFTAKKYLMIQYHCIPSGGIDIGLRAGAGGTIDTGSNFVKKEADGYGSFGTQASDTKLPWGKGSGGANDAHGVGYMVNRDGSEKMWLSVGQDNGGNGSGNTGAVREAAGKWTNTSQANIVSLYQQGGGGYGDLGVGTEITVWGGD